MLLKTEVVLIIQLERALVNTNNIEKYYVVNIREKGTRNKEDEGVTYEAGKF